MRGQEKLWGRGFKGSTDPVPSPKALNIKYYTPKPSDNIREKERLGRLGRVIAFFVDSDRKICYLGEEKLGDCVFSAPLNKHFRKIDYCQLIFGFEEVNRLFTKFYERDLGGSYLTIFNNPAKTILYKKFLNWLTLEAQKREVGENVPSKENDFL